MQIAFKNICHPAVFFQKHPIVIRWARILSDVIDQHSLGIFVMLKRPAR